MSFLKITPRLSLSILLFLLALVLLCSAYIRSTSVNIETAELESQGIIYLQPLVGVLEKLSNQYSLRVSVVAGNKNASTRLKTATDEVEQAFEELRNADSRLQKSLRLSDKELKTRRRENLTMAALLSQWQGIADSDPATIPTAQYIKLMDTLREKAVYVGNTSTLILDPDLDSYYLMHAIVISLPDSVEHLARTENLALVPLSGEAQPTTSPKVSPGILATLLEETDIPHTAEDLQNSYNEDPNHYGISQSLRPNTQSRLDEYNAAGTAFVATIRSLDNSTPADVQTIFRQGGTFHTAIHNLWIASALELDVLLHKRIEHVEKERNLALTRTLLPVLLALGLFCYITHGIIVSLKKIETAMCAIADGALDYTVPCQDMPDEIGSMARTLEKFRKSYWWLDSK